LGEILEDKKQGGNALPPDFIENVKAAFCGFPRRQRQFLPSKFPSLEYVQHKIENRTLELLDKYKTRGFTIDANLMLKAMNEAIQDFLIEHKEVRRKAAIERHSKIIYLIVGAIIGAIAKNIWSK
jgi:hypothetical protein